jgi:DNA-binding CsgD family transcriptional regulator
LSGRRRSTCEIARVVDLLADIRTLALEVADSQARRQRHRYAEIQAALGRLRPARSVAQLIELTPVEVCRCGFDRALLSRVEDERWYVQSCHVAGDPDWADEIVRVSREEDEALRPTLAETEMVRRRRPIIVHAPQAEGSPKRAIATVTGSRSYVAAPIIVEERVIGFLHADCHGSQRHVDESDRDALWLFAEAFGETFQRTELRERLDGLRNQIERMTGSIAAAVNQSVNQQTELNQRAPGDILRPPRGAVASMRAVNDARIGSLLTRRELDVLRLMAAGETNVGIAAKLVISEGTVKSHVKHILRKLRAVNRAEAVATFMRVVHASDQRRRMAVGEID